MKSGGKGPAGQAPDGYPGGDHQVVSRIGLTYPCIYFDEMQQLTVMELEQNACIIVDEAQFLTREEVMYLVYLVDDLGIPVMCYGLRADFKGDLFPGQRGAAGHGGQDRGDQNRVLVRPQGHVQRPV